MHEKPIHTIYAKGVKATIWENFNGEGRPFYTTNVVRSYHDGTEWRETNAYLDHQLPLVELVTREAFKFIQLGARRTNREQAPASDNDLTQTSDRQPAEPAPQAESTDQAELPPGEEEPAATNGQSFAEKVGGRSSRRR